jgi:hypothetical protein
MTSATIPEERVCVLPAGIPALATTINRPIRYRPHVLATVVPPSPASSWSVLAKSAEYATLPQFADLNSEGLILRGDANVGRSG